jgi:nickel superoxide dismutase
MNRNFIICAAFVALVGVTTISIASEPTTSPVAKPVVVAPAPHCQVPCGIYTDQLRFEGMLEDTKTIAKAIAEINTFVDGMGEGSPTAKDINQSVRWVTNKESHATNIQNVMADYFFAQRIKADNKDYTAQLATAHSVIVCAMKCKQDANPATADALKAAILKFYTAYEGKEPNFDKHEEK